MCGVLSFPGAVPCSPSRGAVGLVSHTVGMGTGPGHANDLQSFCPSHAPWRSSSRACFDLVPLRMFPVWGDYQGTSWRIVTAQVTGLATWTHKYKCTAKDVCVLRKTTRSRVQGRRDLSALCLSSIILMYYLLWRHIYPNLFPTI